MASITLEERVLLLERDVLRLKQQLTKSTSIPWWEQINGAFADTPAFDEARDLGREYREAQRLIPGEEDNVSA
jgi:hypothetical protein